MSPEWVDRAIDYLNKFMIDASPEDAAKAVVDLRQYFIYPKKVAVLESLGYKDPREYIEDLRQSATEEDCAIYMYHPNKMVKMLNKYGFESVSDWLQALSPFKIG